METMSVCSPRCKPNSEVIGEDKEVITKPLWGECSFLKVLGCLGDKNWSVRPVKGVEVEEGGTGAVITLALCSKPWRTIP